MELLVGVGCALLFVALGYLAGHKDGYRCGRKSRLTPSRN